MGRAWISDPGDRLGGVLAVALALVDLPRGLGGGVQLSVARLRGRLGLALAGRADRGWDLVVLGTCRGWVDLDQSTRARLIGSAGCN